MEAAVIRANTKVLLQPIPARAVVHASDHVGSAVGRFYLQLGIERAHAGQDAKRWLEALGGFRDKAMDDGADGLESARALGLSALEWARLAPGKVAAGIAARPW